MTEEVVTCQLCGEPMSPREARFFYYHGYSGPCPKPPLPSLVSKDFPASTLAAMMPTKAEEFGHLRPAATKAPASTLARAALAGLRAVVGKMSEGHWHVPHYGGDDTTIEICGRDKPPPVSWKGFDDSFRSAADHRANAEGIAALRNTAPALLRVLESALERNVLTPDELDVLLAGIPKET